MEDKRDMLTKKEQDRYYQMWFDWEKQRIKKLCIQMTIKTVVMYSVVFILLCYLKGMDSITKTFLQIGGFYLITQIAIIGIYVALVPSKGKIKENGNYKIENMIVTAIGDERIHYYMIGDEEKKERESEKRVIGDELKEGEEAIKITIGESVIFTNRKLK